MVGFIFKKRSKMSPKDALLEQAALNAVGLQQTHVIGIVAIIFTVSLICLLAGLKGLTWTLLLLISFTLFAYLMKLTIESGLNVPLGPDGQPIGGDESSDDEDDDDDDDDEDAAYQAPTVPTTSKQDVDNLPPII
jgi:hypothetical protein